MSQRTARVTQTVASILVGGMAQCKDGGSIGVTE